MAFEAGCRRFPTRQCSQSSRAWARLLRSSRPASPLSKSWEADMALTADEEEAFRELGTLPRRVAMLEMRLAETEERRVAQLEKRLSAIGERLDRIERRLNDVSPSP